MLPALSVLALLPLALGAGGCAATAPRSPQPLIVGIVGDQTYNPDLEAAYAVLARGVGILAGRRPEVVLHTGDLVESTLAPERVRADYARAAALLDQLPARWYLTAGDHDVNPPNFVADSSDRSREALFQELYGARAPAFKEHLYYSFDVRGVHFVALYSQERLHADPRWGDVFLARIGDRQLAWLAQDLEAHRAARAVVVFLHQPLWYHWSGWRRVHELLRRYPVAVVVAGHLHYDQDDGTIDGIRYLTVGATGGSTKRGDQEAGDLQAVTVLSVGPRSVVAIELLPVGGGTARLTPREDMDRVQALDVQLGNLWDFAQRNPVFIKDDRLVDRCDGGGPAKVRITPIGDPIDLPLEVIISFASVPATVALGAPTFAPGACLAVESDGTRCRLPAAARTESSNYSSVSIQGVCPCASPPGPGGLPLWEATLVPAGSAPPAPGTVVRLHLRTTFQGASGPHFLECTLETKVAACP